jgi:hypothetical protein
MRSRQANVSCYNKRSVAHTGRVFRVDAYFSPRISTLRLIRGDGADARSSDAGLPGGSDPWIPVGQSVEHLRSLTNQYHNIQYAVVPNASHEMMFVEHDTMAFDEKTTNESAPQTPEYFMLMASWLSRQTKK